MAVRKIRHGRGISYEMTAKIDGKVIRRRFATHKEALDEYARLRSSYNDGTYIAVADLRTTLDTYSVIWFDDQRVDEATDDIYRGDYRRHISPVLGSRPMSQLRRQEVIGLIRVLEDKGLAPSTIGRIYSILAMILRSAVYDRKLVASPCFKIKLPEIEQGELVYFVPADVARLLAATKPRDYAVLATDVGTGLRQGELLGLTVDHLDFLRRELHVEQQLKTPPGAGQPYLKRRLKSKASRRVIPMPQFVVDALGAHIAEYGLGPDGLLFTNPHGTGWRRGSFNDSLWKPTLKRAGLPVGYGIHALRHTYASVLIAEGEHPRVIQARLGHASITETMDTYGHLFPDAHEETVLAMGRAFAELAIPGAYKVAE